MKRFAIDVSAKTVKGLALLGLLAVAACSLNKPKGDVAYIPPADCTLTDNGADNVAAALEKADWSKPKKLEMTLKDDEIEPMMFDLYKGRPYQLVVANQDSIDRMVYSPGFFDAIAVKEITPARASARWRCLKSVELAPGETATINFIPLIEGQYEMFDDVWPLTYARGASGMFEIIN